MVAENPIRTVCFTYMVAENPNRTVDFACSVAENPNQMARFARSVAGNLSRFWLAWINFFPLYYIEIKQFYEHRHFDEDVHWLYRSRRTRHNTNLLLYDLDRNRFAWISDSIKEMVASTLGLRIWFSKQASLVR